ncbi:MAG: isopenicillin N synthase family oxygenase [Microthrixaceae bacterium]|nr:isopenicillin N synthase family oxygenase [Microthrixaceae bacterium]
MQLPVIDVSALTAKRDPPLTSPADPDQMEVARQIDEACRRDGFFLITGHGVIPDLQRRLDRASRAFFDLPDTVKADVAMPRAGNAWRGWFPVGGELTSGQPDLKEGLYFGAELDLDHPRVRAGTALHGPNLFPAYPPDLKPIVLEWMAAMTGLAQQIMVGLALALGLGPNWFATNLTADPTVLFRIFHYPPALAAPVDSPTSVGPDATSPRWGVAEHTDYGLLTLLAQDGSGGLQVRRDGRWLDVDPRPDSFVCNIGDMLDRMTGGRYRSTPHRVLATAVDRLSFPFFFDPSWDAEVTPLPMDGEPPTDDALTRWDETSVHEYRGTYGDYLTAKVAKIFPSLNT